MITKMIGFVLVFFLTQANLVYGETYKCRSSDGRIMYSGTLCPTGSVTVSATETALTSQSVVPIQTNSPNVHMINLDMMVDEAIGTGDLMRARELALTPEHWAKIRVAETPKQKTSTEIKAEQAYSEDCRDAKSRYKMSVMAGGFPQNKELIDANKLLMYSACGMSEPNSTSINTTVNVVR